MWNIYPWLVRLGFMIIFHELLYLYASSAWWGIIIICTTLYEQCLYHTSMMHVSESMSEDLKVVDVHRNKKYLAPLNYLSGPFINMAEFKEK